MTQSSNVHLHQPELVSELIDIVSQLKTNNAYLLKTHLEVVRDYLSGQTGKEKEAKKSWAIFLENIGSVAKFGSRVLELASKISSVLG